MSAVPEIPTAPRQEIIHFNWGNTENIIQVIMKVCDKMHLAKQVKKLSASFKGSDYEKCRAVWQWVREHIPYVPDPVGTQIIKHPARTYEYALNGEGSDCKSMTVFVRFCLENMGIPVKIRFSSYVKSHRIQHVYCVAVIDGKEVIVDTVYEYFDLESPYTYKKDKKPSMTKIVEIAGLQGKPIVLPARPNFPISRLTDAELQLAAVIREMELVATINQARGFNKEADIQKRALSQLRNVYDRGLHAGGARFATIPNIRKYVHKIQRRDYPCYMSHAILGFGTSAEQENYCHVQAVSYANRTVGNQGGGPGPFGEYDDAWQAAYDSYYRDCLDEKEMENVVNARLVDSGTNFLYDQMRLSGGNYNTIIGHKFVNQEAWVYVASNVTGLSEYNIRSIMRTGTIEAIGETPESALDILRPVMVPNSIGLDPGTITLLITAIVSVIGAGIKLINTFVQETKAEKAFGDLLDPASPSFRIKESDFLPLVDSNGNPIPGSTNNGTGGGKALFAGMDLKTIALLALGGKLLFQPSKSK